MVASNSVKPRINNILKFCLEPHTPEEREQLEKNILKDGKITDPITIWRETDEIVDGYTRFEISEKHNLPYQIEFKSFKTVEDAVQWAKDHQRGRRNENKIVKDYLRGKDYNENVSAPGGNMHAVDTVNVGDDLAEKHQVAPVTIRRDAKFAEAIDVIGEVSPQAKDIILSGESQVTKAQVKKVASLPPESLQIAAEKIASGQPIAKVLEHVPIKPIVPSTAKVTFDDRKIANEIGAIHRAFTARAKVHGESEEYKACDKAVEALMAAWNRWQKATT